MLSSVYNYLFLVFSYIEDNKTKFIGNLKDAVSIPSVSASAEHRSDVMKMMDWAVDRLCALNVSVEKCDIGFQVSVFLTITHSSIVITLITNFFIRHCLMELS